VDYLRLDFLLVMEDLMQRDADPRDSTRPLSVEQVAHGLRALAKLHSRYWNFSGRTHKNLGWVKTWKASPGWQVGLAKCVPRGLQRGVDQLPVLLQEHGGGYLVNLWSDYVNTLTRDNVTLLHGDAHIGNTYVLPDNNVGFLDWQVVRRGNWSQDVGYFLVGSLIEDDRRRAERALLDEYRNALELPKDQLPSQEDIWFRYRQSQAYGLAIWLSTLGTDGYQSQEISLALAQRFASAFIELESEKALRGA
jgi:Ser/Thr protein kinase RdoA (MazF antagonist)